MIETETIKQLAAGGLILVTGTVCFVAAVRDPAMRTEHGRREREAGGGASPASALAAGSAVAEDASIAKLRILTGEPGPIEQRRPAPRRALKLILGIGALAAGGALGLLVLVKALISLFRQIGA